MKTEQLQLFLIWEKKNIVEALEKIDSNARGILFATDESGHLTGVVTDGDIRRWLIKTGELTESVDKVMNKEPKVIYWGNLASAQQYMKAQSITALPVVTPERIIEDIVFKEDILKERDVIHNGLHGVPVIVMAGGKGTRLYPFTKILPKPLIPISDIPIMERIIGLFARYGVSEFYATVNYKKDMIKAYFSEKKEKYQLHYIEEEQPLGTAGSLTLLDEKFGKPIIVTNCDILIHGNYEDIYCHHKESGNELTMVTALKNIIVPYGVVRAKENGVISHLEEKPRMSYFVNTGMYIMNEEVLKDIPKQTFFHMTDLTELLLKQGRRVGMYPISEESFLDMGEFEEMHRMEEKLNQKID